MLNGSVSRFGGGWQYRGRTAAGRQFRKVGFATRAQAQSALRERLNHLEIIPDTTKITTGYWFDRWLLVAGETTRKSTCNNYTASLGRIRENLDNVPLDKLDEDQIRQALRDMVERGLSTSTIKASHRRLRQCLDDAVKERKIRFNPATYIKAPQGKPARETVTWSFSEMHTFLKSIEDNQDAALWQFWTGTGLRRGEICGLTWDKVDLDAGTVFINWQRTLTGGEIFEGEVKTDKAKRYVPLDPWVVSVLRAWRARQGERKLKSRNWQGGNYVFTSRRDAPYSPRSFVQQLGRLSDRAGVPVITAHELRHTFGTLAAEAGMEVRALADMMGHTKVETTYNLYIHPKLEQITREARTVTSRMYS